MSEVIESVIHCPLNNCDWYVDATLPPISSNVLAGIFGDGTLQQTALFQHKHDIERKLRIHFEGHSIEDMIGTITLLRNRITDLERQIEREARDE